MSLRRSPLHAAALLACAILLLAHVSLPCHSQADSSSHTLESFPPPDAALPTGATLNSDRVRILHDSEIVPNILPVVPPSITKMAWAGSMRVHELGTVLTPASVRERPRLNYNVHANRLYTVSLVDPDAPSRDEPIFGQWVHWLVVNVPGRDIARGDTLVEYIGAAPPAGSGRHRYVLAVYEQSHKIPLDNLTRITRTQGSGRSKWNVDRFVAIHDAAAKLVSANFFYAEYDSSVDDTYAQITQ